MNIKKIWVDWYNETGIRPEGEEFELHLNQLDTSPQHNSHYNITAVQATGIAGGWSCRQRLSENCVYETFGVQSGRQMRYFGREASHFYVCETSIIRNVSHKRKND